MKRIIVMMLVVSLSTFCFASVRYPSQPSAYRYPKVGQSSYATSRYHLGNDVITGNVSGGKQFRAVVPYGSAYEFRAAQGSSTLNDFYRRTAVTDGKSNQQYSNSHKYLLPSKSVASTMKTSPGRIGNKINLGQTNYQINLQKAQLDRIELGSSLSNSLNRGVSKRPLSRDIQDVKMGLDAYKLRNRDTDYDNSVSELNHALSNAMAKNTMLKPLLQNHKTATTKVDTITTGQAELRPILADKENSQSLDKTDDLYLQMLDKVQEDFKEALSQKRIDDIAEAEKQAQLIDQKQSQQRQRIKQILEQSDSAYRQKKAAAADKQADNKVDDQVELPETIKTFASKFRYDSFNEYMAQAEEFMRAGRYYKAADAYSLASAYQNSNPLPYIGRSIALFAAGEYMSSSYYLNMSLRIFSQLALFKIDLSSFIADKDVLDNRVSELNTMQIQSSSPELRFLQAYIYLNLGKTDKAREAIKDSADKLPDDAAVKVLKEAIEKN